MPNEADTCRRYIVPLLQRAGWDEPPHRINEQVPFTDGRVIVTGRAGRRRPGKRADYLLRLRPDFAIAVIEAKPSYRNPGDGLQQAKEYAEILGLKFAYSTNGHGIIEYDFTTGLERGLDRFPTPPPRPPRPDIAKYSSPTLQRLPVHDSPSTRGSRPWTSQFQYPKASGGREPAGYPHPRRAAGVSPTVFRMPMRMSNASRVSPRGNYRWADAAPLAGISTPVG
jgi:hypothetical protein